MPPKVSKTGDFDALEQDELVKKQAETEDLRQRVEDTLSIREEPYKVLKQFISKNKISRLTLETLQKLTSDYHKLEELDSQLAVDYTSWLSLVDEQALEDSADALASTKVEALFEEFGEVKDKVVELFTTLAKQYPEHHKVKEYLKFLPQHDIQNLPPLPKSSASSVSGRGEAYVKAKIPKIQNSVEDAFASFESVFAETPDKRSIRIEDIERLLSDLERKIAVDSAYDKFLRELFEFEDTDVDYQAAETWQEETLESIKSLQKLVQSERKKTVVSSAQQSKSSNQTFLKKRDPPPFKGDCLEFLDFQRKWKNQVHSNNLPEEFELDLLKNNILEQGSKKLFGVELSDEFD